MQRVAIVDRDSNLPSGEIAAVAGALNVQVVRDLRPRWHVDATVDYFPDLDQVPEEAYVVFLVGDAEGKGGAHMPPEDTGAPFAIVQAAAGSEWSLAASHEVLEMLVDPSCARTVRAPDPRGLSSSVEFLVEICDPCQDRQNAYRIESVLVSDFCLPSYYGIGEESTGPYTMRSKISRPRDVADGGLVTWIEGTAENQVLYQRSAVAGPPLTLGPVAWADAFGKAQRPGNLRGAIDRCSLLHKRSHVTKADSTYAKARYHEVRKELAARSRLRAKRLLKRLDQILGAPAKAPKRGGVK